MSVIICNQRQNILPKCSLWRSCSLWRCVLSDRRGQKGNQNAWTLHDKFRKYKRLTFIRGTAIQFQLAIIGGGVVLLEYVVQDKNMYVFH